MLPGIRFHSFANGYCTNRSTIRGADGRLCDNELLAPLESPAGENIASTRAPHAVQKTKCTIALAILRSVGSSHVSIPPLMKLFYIIPERPWLSKHPCIVSGTGLHLSASGFAMTSPARIPAAPSIISGVSDS